MTSNERNVIETIIYLMERGVITDEAILARLKALVK